METKISYLFIGYIVDIWI